MARYDHSDEPYLLVIRGPDQGRRIPIAGGVIIGRSAHASGPFAADLRMSRRHAEVIFDAAGALFIRDLGSANGTFVNDVAVTEEDLFPGDQVDVGDTTLEVVQPVPPVSQRGTRGAINVGGDNRAPIRADNRSYQWNVDGLEELNWWARATGPAKFVVLVGLLLGLTGLGVFGYPILQGSLDQDATRQAQNACYAEFPQPGFEQNNCILRATQGSEQKRKPTSQWTVVGGGLLFAALVLTIVARKLPGAEGPKKRSRGR
jgi:hypothetical protein